MPTPSLKLVTVTVTFDAFFGFATTPTSRDTSIDLAKIVALKNGITAITDTDTFFLK